MGFAESMWGRPARIARAMCGLPVAGASFRSYLTGHLKELGYQPCLADRDVHCRADKKANGVE